MVNMRVNVNNAHFVYDYSLLWSGILIPFYIGVTLGKKIHSVSYTSKIMKNSHSISSRY